MSKLFKNAPGPFAMRRQFLRLSTIYSVSALLLGLIQAWHAGVSSAIAIALALVLLIATLVIGAFPDWAFREWRERVIFPSAYFVTLFTVMALSRASYFYFELATIGFVFFVAATRTRIEAVGAAVAASLLTLAIVQDDAAVSAMNSTRGTEFMLFCADLYAPVITAWVVASFMDLFDAAESAGVRNREWTENATEREIAIESEMPLVEESRANVEALAEMTTRQREVIELLADGYSNDEIAERLGIATRTVDTHVQMAIQATGLGNRTRLAVTAAVADELGAARARA
jgi:DNA-binding CsgD family transcriptional regulator